MNQIQDIKQNNKFQGQVLNRVYKVWLFRKFLPVLLGEIIIFSVAIYWFTRTVFVRQVLENALNIPLRNPTGIITYFIMAFTKTHTSTKILTVLIVILVALLVRLITQGILRLILVRKNYFGKTDAQ